jgi:hypothetical protein
LISICRSPAVQDVSAENQLQTASQFSHAGPVAWNSLLNFIRSESNTKSFKKLLKTFYVVVLSISHMKCPPVYCSGGFRGDAWNAAASPLGTPQRYDFSKVYKVKKHTFWEGNFSCLSWS